MSRPSSERTQLMNTFIDHTDNGHDKQAGATHFLGITAQHGI